MRVCAAADRPHLEWYITILRTRMDDVVCKDEEPRQVDTVCTRASDAGAVTSAFVDNKLSQATNLISNVKYFDGSHLLEIVNYFDSNLIQIQSFSTAHSDIPCKLNGSTCIYADAHNTRIKHCDQLAACCN